MEKKLLKIGKILSDGTIQKEFAQLGANQGIFFKDEEAFINKKGICYSPEDSDETYTYDDYINITKEFLGRYNGDIERVARMFFDYSEWQHVETLAEEWEDDLHEYPESFGVSLMNQEEQVKNFRIVTQKYLDDLSDTLNDWLKENNKQKEFLINQISVVERAINGVEFNDIKN